MRYQKVQLLLWLPPLQCLQQQRDSQPRSSLRHHYHEPFR